MTTSITAEIEERRMTEYVNVRASEILGQEELVSFLKSRFPEATKPIGRTVVEGTECVEVRVPSNSGEFEEIRKFIDARRKQGQRGFADFTIGWYLRKYTKTELQNAEVLRLTIASHFEPSGEECGTIYETLCNHCNWGRQVSDLILDLRRVPQHKDVSETIAWVERVVSSNFVRTFTENKLTGAEFRPIFEFKNPTKQSKDWHQLRVTGKAGELAESTRLGRDPFSPSQISWRCPLGHSVVTEFLSEIYLQRSTWDGSDITVTEALFGQGRNLLRPTPLIIISQRMYHALQKAGLKGFSVEVAHLV
jgi:hypothetical protein